MNELIAHDAANSLKEKVNFLRYPSAYRNVTTVEVLETHMSWVFLTDKYVYKLKKPVIYPFLDFSTLRARRKYCVEEIRINKPLAGDTYCGVVALKSFCGAMQLGGKGETIDYLVKMKRLLKGQMLETAITNRTVRNEHVQMAAEKLVDFYLTSLPVILDATRFRRKLVKDIELDSAALSDSRSGLKNSQIIAVTASLLHFLIRHAELFDQRIAERKIIDAHGDLRPEHIFLGQDPVIIDRIEFNRDLRVMDMVEELSALAMECDILGTPATGQLFLNVYQWKCKDKIPDMLVNFYKAKRAFLRAKLSINHLLEEKYLTEEEKWKSRGEAYLKAANDYCEHLSKEC
jgi:aminoglycoside phosphotransferase family enzyme